MRLKTNSSLPTFGSIAAIGMVLVVIGTWRAGPAAFVGWPVWLGRSFIILLAAIAAIVEKRKLAGALGFRPALKITYGVIVMGIVAQSIMVWLIANLLDPAFYLRLVPVLVAKTESAYRRAGATDDQLRQVLDDIRNNNQFSLGRVVSGTGYQLVLFFIVAVLIAATVKSKKRAMPGRTP